MTAYMNTKITVRVYDLIVIHILLLLIFHIVNRLGGAHELCRELYRMI